MKRHLRKSINPRQSFHLPQDSDISDSSVNIDQLQHLQEIAVAARPSLMSSPHATQIIPEDSNVTSAELKRQFHNDPEWYKRLPKLSSPSFIPRAQAKTLRPPDDEDFALEVTSDRIEEQTLKSGAASAFRKPFRNKRHLFSHTLDFEKVLGDATFTEDSQSERSSRRASKGPVATRRSARLLSETHVESPVESPREAFRRWKSTGLRQRSSTLADAIEERRITNEIIDESSESSSATYNPKSSESGSSYRASQTKVGRKSLKRGMTSEENDVLTNETSFASPPVRPKPFGKSKKGRSVAQSPESTSNRLTVRTEDVSNIEDSRPKSFPERKREKRPSYGRIMDADDSQLTLDWSGEAEAAKSAENGRPSSGTGSRNFVGQESPMFVTGRKPFANTRRLQRGSSVFADAFDDDLSAAETEFVGELQGTGRAADVKKSPTHVTNVSSEPREAVEAVNDGAKSARSTSLTERHGRRSRRSSAFVVAMDDESHTDVAQKGGQRPEEEGPRSAQSTPKKRRTEQEVSSPEQDTHLPSRGWKRVVPKEKRRMDEFDEILSMDNSSIDSLSNKNEDDDNVCASGGETVPVSQSVFVAPAIPPKRISLQERLSLKSTPRVVIVPLRDGAVTSTPTPNATKMVVSSPISSIENLSKEVRISDHSDRATTIEVLPQQRRHSRRSGAVNNSHGNRDYDAENELSKDKSLKEKSTRLPQQDVQEEGRVDSVSEGLFLDAKGVLTSPIPKSPLKRKSATLEARELRGQSSRQMVQTENAKKSKGIEDTNRLTSTEKASMSLNSKSPSKQKSRVSEESQNRRRSSRHMGRSVSAERSTAEEKGDAPSDEERALLAPNSQSPSKQKSSVSEESQNRRRSSRHMGRSVSAERSSAEEKGDAPSDEERALLAPNPQSPSKRKSSVSEESQNRRRSSRHMGRSVSAERSTAEEKGDSPSNTERALLAPNSQSPSKQKTSVSEESQNRRRSSRYMGRSVSAERSSAEEKGDAPSDEERALLAPNSQSPSKQKSSVSEESQNRRRSSRHMGRPVSAERSSAEEKGDAPSDEERALLGPNPQSPSKLDSSVSEESRNRRRSSRQMGRSVSAERSSADEKDDEGSLSTAERTLISQSRRKRKSEQLQTRGQSSRQIERSLGPEKPWTEEDEDSLSSAKRTLTSPNKSSPYKSPSRTNRKFTLSHQEQQKKRQSLREMVLPPNTVESFEEDEVISLKLSTLRSGYFKSPSVEERYQKRKSGLELDENSVSLRRDIEIGPSSVEYSSLPQTSNSLPKRSSLFKQIEDNNIQSYRNADSSPKISNRADQTGPITDYDSSQQTKNGFMGSVVTADSVRKVDSLNSVSTGSEDESDERLTSSEVKRMPRSSQNQGKKIIATSALSVSSAYSISLVPSGNLIDMSSKPSRSKRSEAREVESSKENSHSNFTVTGKVSGREDASQDESHDEALVSDPLEEGCEERAPTTDRRKKRSSAKAAATSREEAAMPPPPKKSVIPQNVRSDIRSFFVKSTPLKDHQANDSSDTLVPLNATAITPIKKLMADGSQFSQGSSRTVAENAQDKELDPKFEAASGTSSSRVQQLMKQLMERVPRKKEAADSPLPQPVRVLPKPKAESSQKPARKKFQLILPDGKVYKQPKLSKPRKFVSDKMYRFITKNIKNNAQLDTRIRAEEFVRRLCDTYDKVLRRKKTKELVEDLLEYMVGLGLVSTYAEFYYFVEKFMPFSFRMKAIPCIGSDLAPKPRKGIYEKLEFD